MFMVLPHAAQRFQERVRPTLTEQQAGVELKRLLESFGELVEWEPRDGVSGDHCYEVAPGIWVPCFVNSQGVTVATTVLTEDWLPPHVRKRRNSKRLRRHAKRSRARAERRDSRSGLVKRRAAWDTVE